jgi:hypothetical protein
MKKPKHPTEWEEPSADSSKEINAVLDDLGELDDLDDEIIDLEDVVESYSEEGMEDDDGFASDTEILDAEGSLGLRGFESQAESDDEFILEDDFLKELPFFQDEKAEPEPDQREDFMAEEVEELAPGLFGESGEEAVEGSDTQPGTVVPDERELEPFILPVSALGAGEPEQDFSASPVAASLVEEPGLEFSVPQVEGSIPEEAQPELSVLPVAALVIEEPELEVSPLPMEASVLDEAQPEIFVPPLTASVFKEPEVSAPPVAASAEAGILLDDFVAQIENKLVDTIREIVEARLPEIVRMVLREEIAKLTSDQDPED